MGPLRPKRHRLKSQPRCLGHNYKRHKTRTHTRTIPSDTRARARAPVPQLVRLHCIRPRLSVRASKSSQFDFRKFVARNDFLLQNVIWARERVRATATATARATSLAPNVCTHSALAHVIRVIILCKLHAWPAQSHHTTPSTSTRWTGARERSRNHQLQRQYCANNFGVPVRACVRTQRANRESEKPAPIMPTEAHALVVVVVVVVFVARANLSRSAAADEHTHGMIGASACTRLLISVTRHHAHAWSPLEPPAQARVRICFRVSRGACCRTHKTIAGTIKTTCMSAIKRSRARDAQTSQQRDPSIFIREGTHM